MAYQMMLPEKKKQREKIVKALVSRGKSERSVQDAKFWYSWLYMQGARDFNNIDYENGTVDVIYAPDSDRKNLQQFKYEGVVPKYQAQMGRLRRIDLNPDVGYMGLGLNSLQKAGIARMILRSLINQQKVEEMSNVLWPALLMFGTVGLQAWAVDNHNMGIEVVMPWEIIPIPSTAQSKTEVRGVGRRRYVPIEWIQKLPYAKEKNSKIWDEMEKKKVSRVSALNDEPGDNPSGGGVYEEKITQPLRNETGYGGKDGESEEEREVAELVEIWMYTDDGHLGEYIVHAGGKEFHHKDFSGEKRQVPLQIARYIDTGNFWGRSFVEIMIPMNAEVEFMSGKMFQNIEDLDLYGIMLEPTTLGVDAQATAGQDGVKRLRYEPDYTAPDLSVDSLQPANTGTMPGKVMEMAHAMMDNLANQPTEMMQGGAPGRVDSSSGLGMILETSNIPLTPVAANVVAAIAGCYSYVLDYVKHTWTDGDTVRVTQIDDALAGITFDSEMGEMSLDKNAIPSVDEINVTVANQMPRSIQQEKMEMKESLQMGLLTPMEFRLEVRKRQLDIPVGADAEWQNYRRAIIENILLYNDGKEPGKIIFTERDLHKVHMKALDDFMAKPEFQLASQPVRDAFINHYNEHKFGMGDYPSQLPYPEQVALQQQQQGKQGGPQGMPPGMPQGMPQGPPQGGQQGPPQR